MGLFSTQPITPKKDKFSPLLGALNNLKTTIYVLPNSCLVARDRIKVGGNDLNYKSAAAKPSVPLVTGNQTLVASLMGQRPQNENKNPRRSFKVSQLGLCSRPSQWKLFATIQPHAAQPAAERQRTPGECWPGSQLLRATKLSGWREPCSGPAPSPNLTWEELQSKPNQQLLHNNILYLSGCRLTAWWNSNGPWRKITLGATHFCIWIWVYLQNDRFSPRRKKFPQPLTNSTQR